jgi:hypothetical protein
VTGEEGFQMKRKRYGAEFKAQVALAAIKGHQTATNLTILPSTLAIGTVYADDPLAGSEAGY